MNRSCTYKFLLFVLLNGALALAMNHEGLKDRRRRTQGLHRIVGGELAGAGEFPSFAYDCCCGGTLIHPDIVMRAAHCGFNNLFPKGSSIYIGGTKYSGSDAEERFVDTVLRHECKS